MKTLTRISILALAAATAAVPAAAAIRVATYTGTAQQAYDLTGVFGTVGEFSGATVSITYRYDTSLGMRYGAPGSYDYVIGGDVYGGASPMLSASIKVNGVIANVGVPAYAAFAYTQPGLVQHLAQHYSFVGGVYTYNYAYNYGYVAGATDLLENNVPQQGLFSSYGYFQIYTQDSEFGTVNYAYGNFFADEGTFSLTGGVPEPSTWAMLIAGFGLVGATARRRRAAVA